MTKDVGGYTDSIIEFMRRVGRPVTMSEISEATGMSRQATYQWRDRNARLLRVAGKGRHGADAYVLAPDAEEALAGRATATWQVVDGPARFEGRSTTAVAERVRLGQTFRVAGMRLTDDGRTSITLAGDGGATIEVVV